MIRALLGLFALTAALSVGGMTVAQTPTPKKAPVKAAPSKAAAAKLKKIVTKIDPEIRAAQLALRTAKSKLQRALNDEVFKEKGPVEGKVIDQLKVALRDVDAAIKRTNLAQVLDKGGD
jgi:hypothetical protein